MRNWLRLVCAWGLALTLAGCVLVGDRLDQARWHFGTVPFFVFDNAEGYKQPPQPPVIEEPVNVCIAISGGGVRSAVFAAGVLEQLAYIRDPRNDSQSLLDGVDAVSAVSGGSVAASYFGLYKPARFDLGQETSAFFQQFKSNMTLDMWMRSWFHYLSHPWEGGAKYYTRYRFVQSFANNIDRHLFKGATFAHLSKREAAGEAPAIILYAASLDTGQRFLFSNLNTAENFGADPQRLMKHLPSVTSAGDRAGMQMLAKLTASPVYRSMGFDTINSDISSFRIASAIAASSAYPGLPGPAAFINYSTDGYVHVADGGINDNFGVDALIEMYLTKLQSAKRGKRLVVISIDSTGASPQTDKTLDPNGYVGTLAYGEKAFVSQTMRAQTFATALYGSLDAIQVIPVRLAGNDGTERLEDLAFGGSISEKDMYIVLGAAQAAVARAQGDITRAISGAN